MEWKENSFSKFRLHLEIVVDLAFWIKPELIDLHEHSR